MGFKVTVVIPTYNGGDRIHQAISSIKNQTLGFNNIELIIVDNDSNDSTKEVLKEYSNNYPNIKTIFQGKNTGTPSSGRNIGVDNASSKYVMFLDDDDIFVNDMCETLYNTIEKYNVNIVMCNHKTILNGDFSSFDESNQNKSSIIRCDPKENDHILWDNFMWNKIFNVDFLRKFNVKCPVGCYCEDPVFCIKAYLNTDEIIYLNEYWGILYNVRDEKSNFSASNRFNPDSFLRLFKGYVIVINQFKEANRQDLINEWLKFHFVNFLSSFVRLDATYSEKIKFLKDLVKFKKYANFSERLNESWAEIISKNLDKGNYKFIIFYANMINKLYSSSALRMVYRSVYNKFT